MKRRFALVLAALPLALLTACGSHEIQGVELPTDPDEICRLVEDGDLSADQENGINGPLLDEELKEYREWANDIGNNELSRGFRMIEPVLRYDDLSEVPIDRAMEALRGYDHVSEECSRLGYTAVNIYNNQ